MSAAVTLSLQLTATIAACLVLPPLLAGLADAACRRFDAKKQGLEIPSLWQPFSEFIFLWRSGSARDGQAAACCGLASAVFHLAALILLALQQNLMPVLFFQAAGAAAMIVGAAAEPSSGQERRAEAELRSFLRRQPVLFMTAIGIFFVTGSFQPAAVKAAPRLLFLDLPLICLALLWAAQTLIRLPSRSGGNGAGQAAARLADCYAGATLLLLAGFLFARGLAGATAAAVLILPVLIRAGARCAAPAWRLWTGWGWECVLSACVLNWLWLYIKYWL